MPPTQNFSPGIQWHEVTWYSKLSAIILFIGVIPALCFYIGEQYGEVQQINAYDARQIQISKKEPPDIQAAASVQNSSAISSESVEGYYTALDRHASLNVQQSSPGSVTVEGAARYARGNNQYNTGDFDWTIGTLHDNVAHIPLNSLCDLYLVFYTKNTLGTEEKLFRARMSASETTDGGVCNFGTNVSFEGAYARESTTTHPLAHGPRS